MEREDPLLMARDVMKKSVPDTAESLTYSSLFQLFELKEYSWVFIREA